MTTVTPKDLGSGRGWVEAHWNPNRGDSFNFVFHWNDASRRSAYGSLNDSPEKAQVDLDRFIETGRIYYPDRVYHLEAPPVEASIRKEALMASSVETKLPNTQPNNTRTLWGGADDLVVLEAHQSHDGLALVITEAITLARLGIVVVGSLTHSAAEIQEQIVAMVIASRDLNPEQVDDLRLQQGWGRLAELESRLRNLRIVDMRGFGPEQLDEQLLELVIERNASCGFTQVRGIVVDQIKAMVGPKFPDYNEAGDQLAKLARKYRLPVVVSVQLDRNADDEPWPGDSHCTDLWPFAGRVYRTQAARTEELLLHKNLAGDSAFVPRPSLRA